MEITHSPQITPKQNKISIIVSVVLIVLLVGSVYISQLISQEIAQSFNINILELD